MPTFYWLAIKSIGVTKNILTYSTPLSIEEGLVLYVHINRVIACIR